MSKNLWIEKARQLEKLYREKLVEVRRLIAEMNPETPQPQRTNRRYPRSPGLRGPSIVRCESCGIKGPLLAKGLCKRCYKRIWSQKRRELQRRQSERAFERNRRQSMKQP